MLLGARQFFERRGSPTPPLPYDAEVEWIRSDGSSFIQLPDVAGWAGKQFQDVRGRFSCDLTISTISSMQTLFAIANSKVLRTMASSSIYTLQFLFPLAKTTSPSQAPNLSRAHVEYVLTDSSVRYVLNGEDFSSFAWTDFTSVHKTGWVDAMRLLADGNASGTQWGQVGQRFCTSSSLHSVKYWSGDGAAVFDLVPVRITNEQKQGEGAIYNKVSGQLFRNSGTGAILYGPDKS